MVMRKSTSFKSLTKSLLNIFLAVVFLLQIPSIAYSEIAFFIRGHGYGHAVGMCQYGAQGMASNGKKASEILGFYFTGTSIRQYSDQSVIMRVLIDQKSTLYLSGTKKITLINENTGGTIYQGASGSSNEILKLEYMKTQTGDTVIRVSKKNSDGSFTVIGSYSGPVKLTGEEYVSYLGDKRYNYSGYLKILISGTSLLLVNYVGLETYVYGIAEMPSSWNIEALKAQAIAARTYAYKKHLSPRSSSYDLKDDVNDQVYIGMGKITSSYGTNWKIACDATKKQILYYGSGVAFVYYHSTCGGYTENSEDVWSTAYPYLKSVKCDYCTGSPYRNWETSVTLSKLRSAFNEPNVVKAIVLEKIKERRVRYVRLYRSDASYRDVRGSEFRTKLGLRSTWFEIATSAIRINGSDRYTTSVEVSKRTFDSAEAVVIASGESFADALAAAPLAGALNAPMLLVGKNYYPSSVKYEIKRLKPSKAFVVGGKSVVSSSVEEGIKNTLTSLSSNTTRIYGTDRFLTNLALIKELKKIKDPAPDRVFIVNAYNFPDALAVSSIAYKTGSPIVMTDGEKITDYLLEEIKDLPLAKLIIVGGTAVVSSQLEGFLKNEFPGKVERWAGGDRYETSTIVAEKSLLFEYGFNCENVAISSGENFPDALSSSSFTGKNYMVLLLTPNERAASPVKRFIKNKDPKNVYILGGYGAVSINAEIDLLLP